MSCRRDLESLADASEASGSGYAFARFSLVCLGGEHPAEAGVAAVSLLLPSRDLGLQCVPVVDPAAEALALRDAAHDHVEPAGMLRRAAPRDPAQEAHGLLGQEGAVERRPRGGRQVVDHNPDPVSFGEADIARFAPAGGKAGDGTARGELDHPQRKAARVRPQTRTTMGALWPCRPSRDAPSIGPLAPSNELAYRAYDDQVAGLREVWCDEAGEELKRRAHHPVNPASVMVVPAHPIG